MPEWETLVSRYAGPTRLRLVEASRAETEIESLGISKFPTFILTSAGTPPVEYTGERTAEAFTKFLDA
jgi:protein-disulfide isomerase-like protein with CxxC motif